MTHTDWDLQRARLCAYLDSELSATERAEIDAHLAGCDECQRELAALRQTRGLLRALPAPALPRSFTLPETPTPMTRRSGAAPRWARPAQALGGMAAAAGLGLLVAATLPHPSVQYGAAATSQPSGAFGGASTSGGAMPSTAAGAAATAPGAIAATPTPTDIPSGATEHTPAYSPKFAQNTEPFPALPVTGGTLLVGGAAALTVGSLARRRERGAGLPDADPAD